MRIPGYLQRNRFGVYHFRRAVPRRLRAAIGQSEIVRSLNTREPKAALNAARLLAHHVDNLFAGLEAAVASKKKTYRTNFGFEIDLGEGKKAKLEVKPEDIAAMGAAQLSPEQITEVLTAPFKFATGLAGQTVSTAETGVQPGPTLSALIKEFNADRVATKPKGWHVPTGDLTKFRRLVEITDDFVCTDVTRQTARNIRNTLALLPENSARFRDQTVHEILKLPHEKTLSAKSIKDHIGLYASLFKWAKREGFYTAENPFEDIAPRDSVRKNEKRSPFTIDELLSIFSTDVFTAFDTKRHKPHQYWAPLIALHTGARNAEIAALEINDIKEIEDKGRTVWVFDINTEADRKRVKTANAIRHIPIHDTLLSLGLLNYRDQVRASGQTRLFPYLNWEEKNGYGRWIGEHFTQLLKRLKIHVPRKKVFYSFRHTIATALERAEVQAHRIEQLSGRSIQGFKSVGLQYYISPAEAIDLHKDLMKVDFSNQLQNVNPFMEMVNPANLRGLFKRLCQPS